MSGSRTPSPFDPWGRWAHVLAVRLGDARLDIEALQASRHAQQELRDPDPYADRLLLAAWLGKSPPGWDAALVGALVQALHRAGLPWKADLVMQACDHLGWPVPLRPADAPPPWSAQFFARRQDAWRDALAAIAALADGKAATVEQPLSTLRWRLELDDAGRVYDLQALEPAATARGRPKPLTPLQLKKRTRLDPRDAAVARCLRQGRYRASEVSYDLVQAAAALVGHPALELHDAPGVAVELVESLPVLEVRREPRKDGGEHFVFRLHDDLLADDEPELDHHLPDYDQMEAEAERRDSLRIVRDSPERARLIRISAAQRRVAELVAQRWTVPVDAMAELDAALRVLSGHFVLHSDAAAGEPVPSDARLVAQLQPRGESLLLTLAVRPFGDFGPLLVPGHGRARLMTLRGGVSLATEREIDAESAHLAAVLDRLPFLAGEEPSPDGVWRLDEPEHALAAVHELGRLAGEAQVLRTLEWPKGRPLRVIEPDAKAFATTLASGRDWFALQGELRLDEERVLSLQQLLGLLREARGSRYVALGEGQYLALADQLRQRLAELDALAAADGERLKMGVTAATWLAEAAPTLGVKGDAAWRKRAADLERAAALQPEVPHGLQAALRPYQHDGYVWLSRLAEAGFGAVLADDMGLGKTVQTLALLLARSAAGPALVVAPTSVCGNWAEEMARFAPGLHCSVYGQGEGERAAQIEAAAAGDVLIVSYALLLRDAEAFAAKPWATLVLDEAQALKNAATQRVQAVATLQAGFRLALSGTPVENRLADLWSIMNLLNPGLLGSAARFAERFGNPIERQRNEAARSRLRRLVSPFLLRRTKAQVLTELPPRTEIVQRIEPEAEERAFLEAMRRDALARIAQLDPADPNKNRFNVLAELTRLRRAACDPRLAAPELGRIGAKVRAFERLAAELVESRHQALVFSQFTDFLKLLAERLDAAGLKYQYLDGSTPAAARSERVAAFQRGEADLFLISLKAGGFGLNLTAADYVVIADPWWNPAAEDQAMGRAHRIGQQRPVTVYRLVTAGSVEERIVALHQDKRELAEGLLAGQDGGVPLAAAELIDLLRDGP
jgi:superfamily II DNA or RNA helicase